MARPEGGLELQQLTRTRSESCQTAVIKYRAFDSLGSQAPNHRVLVVGAAEVVLRLKQMAGKWKS